MSTGRPGTVRPTPANLDFAQNLELPRFRLSGMPSRYSTKKPLRWMYTIMIGLLLMLIIRQLRHLPGPNQEQTVKDR